MWRLQTASRAVPIVPPSNAVVVVLMMQHRVAVLFQQRGFVCKHAVLTAWLLVVVMDAQNGQHLCQRIVAIDSCGIFEHVHHPFSDRRGRNAADIGSGARCHLVHPRRGCSQRAIQSTAQVSGIVWPETPSVVSIFDKLLNCLAIPAAKHRDTGGHGLGYNHAPLIRQGRKRQNSAVAVNLRKLIISNGSQ